MDGRLTQAPARTPSACVAPYIYQVLDTDVVVRHDLAALWEAADFERWPRRLLYAPDESHRCSRLSSAAQACYQSGALSELARSLGASDGRGGGGGGGSWAERPCSFSAGVQVHNLKAWRRRNASSVLLSLLSRRACRAYIAGTRSLLNAAFSHSRAAQLELVGLLSSRWAASHYDCPHYKGPLPEYDDHHLDGHARGDSRGDGRSDGGGVVVGDSWRLAHFNGQCKPWGQAAASCWAAWHRAGGAPAASTAAATAVTAAAPVGAGGASCIKCCASHIDAWLAARAAAAGEPFNRTAFALRNDAGLLGATEATAAAAATTTSTSVAIAVSAAAAAAATQQGGMQRGASASVACPAARAPDAPAFCACGVQHASRVHRVRVCCALGCGTCGGARCQLRPGGNTSCCLGPIKRRGRRCAAPHETGCFQATGRTA